MSDTANKEKYFYELLINLSQSIYKAYKEELSYDDFRVILYAKIAEFNKESEQEFDQILLNTSYLIPFGVKFWNFVYEYIENHYTNGTKFGVLRAMYLLQNPNVDAKKELVFDLKKLSIFIQKDLEFTQSKTPRPPYPSVSLKKGYQMVQEQLVLATDMELNTFEQVFYLYLPVEIVIDIVANLSQFVK